MEPVAQHPAVTYIATFQAEAWVNDNAIPVDPGGPTEWDCTAFVDDNVRAYLRTCERRERESLTTTGVIDADDVLKSDPAAPQWIREWGGPFTIRVRSDACDGCGHCRFPGIRWPASPDLSSEHSFVEACDDCERYESDADAAIALVELLGGGIRIGCAMRSAGFGQTWEDEPRWWPEGASAKDINESDLWPPSGYSLCVDREERDR